ncbi:MAG: YigZ family protein [Ghiorsea sp.]
MTQHFSQAYAIPAHSTSDEQIIKRSRFISCIAHAEHKQQAVDFVQCIKGEYPDARHHCWAYIAGHPTVTTDIASSDDGEPQGTAGKPILNVLQHRGIGEIVLVVVRYFGGIKLGAGGLVRAYSSSAHLAMEKLETKQRIASQPFTIAFAYDLERNIQHLLQEQHIPISQTSYSERILYHIEVPKQHIQHINQALIQFTSGKVSLKSNV